MKINYLALGIGVLIMAEILTGCSDYRKARTKEAQSLLEEKYQEEFVVTEYRGQQLFEKSYTVWAYSREHPELLF